MASSTRISRPRFAAFTLALVAVLALAAGGVAQAQDEVRIDLEAGADRRIGILVESFVPAGDRAVARPKAVEADPILANDLENSTVFAVARAWDATGAAAQAVTAVVSATLTVKGTSVTLSGRLSDFPARRLIAKSEYRGTTAELRRLVHRFADDIILQLTGESGVSQTQIAYVSKAAKSSELWVVDIDGHGARALTAFKAPITSPTWSPESRRRRVLVAARSRLEHLCRAPAGRRGAPAHARGHAQHRAGLGARRERGRPTSRTRTATARSTSRARTVPRRGASPRTAASTRRRRGRRTGSRSPSLPIAAEACRCTSWTATAATSAG